MNPSMPTQVTRLVIGRWSFVIQKGASQWDRHLKLPANRC